MTAVQADPFLEVIPGMRLLADPPAVGRLHPWRRSFDLVSANRSAARSARIEPKDIPVLVLEHLHITLASWTEKMAARRFEAHLHQ
jgi:hypothetical protein